MPFSISHSICISRIICLGVGRPWLLSWTAILMDCFTPGIQNLPTVFGEILGQDPKKLSLEKSTGRGWYLNSPPHSGHSWQKYCIYVKFPSQKGIHSIKRKAQISKENIKYLGFITSKRPWGLPQERKMARCQPAPPETLKHIAWVRGNGWVLLYLDS